MDPAHRQDRMDEPKVTYRVISRCLCWAFRAAEETMVELEVVLSCRRSGVRAEAIVDAEVRPFQTNSLHQLGIGYTVIGLMRWAG
jgi:hypothetical protein